MWATTIRVEAPSDAWCRDANAFFPDVSVQVLSYYVRSDGRALEVVSLGGAAWPGLVERLRERVEEIEVLEAGERGAKVSIASRGWGLPAAIEATGLVPQLPIAAADGAVTWTLVGPREDARAFCESVRAEGLSFALLSSVEHRPHAALTPRQQEVREAALRHGYYDYPRRITLSNLAKRIGIAKSTLSQSLTMIESQVMKTIAPAGKP